MIKFKYFVAIVALFIFNTTINQTNSFSQNKEIYNKTENVMDLFYGPKTIDFGQVEENEETIDVYFSIRNPNKIDLIVETIQPSCGCIVPTYHKAPIHFDEYDDMMLTIKIKGRKGLFKKSITLNSNFGSRTIEVKGYIN